MVGRKCMGKQYSFECTNCNLKSHLLEGVGKYSPAPSRNFYCSECEKISHTDSCDFCKKN